jgi:urease accessory protein
VLDTSWQARLRLSFVRDGTRSVLGERVHSGPLRVQRPFYPEGDGVCHVYVLHPPGGLVGGDCVRVDVSVESGAHALLTTPAAGKLYRSLGSVSEQTQTLRVAAGARLEWLPQETIAFDGALGRLSTSIVLERDARFIGWDILCLGRPAANERFEHGEVNQTLELTRDEQALYLERGSYLAGAAVMSAAWGLAGAPVVGTLLCAGGGAGSCVEAARQVALPRQGVAAVSGWDDLLVARYLGPCTEQARDYFAALWLVLRPAIMGQAASPPRIWRT